MKTQFNIPLLLNFLSLSGKYIFCSFLLFCFSASFNSQISVADSASVTVRAGTTVHVKNSAVSAKTGKVYIVEGTDVYNFNNVTSSGLTHISSVQKDEKKAGRHRHQHKPTGKPAHHEEQNLVEKFYRVWASLPYSETFFSSLYHTFVSGTNTFTTFSFLAAYGMPNLSIAFQSFVFEWYYLGEDFGSAYKTSHTTRPPPCVFSI